MSTASSPSDPPTATQVAKGSTVKITIGKGPERTAVPNLVGQNFDTAKANLENLGFNTAISALMIFVNEAMTWETLPRAIMIDFLKLLQPLAPHLAGVEVE